MIKENIFQHPFQPEKEADLPVILVLDSCEEARYFITQCCLKGCGVRVIEVADTTKAKYWLTANPAPSLIIMDFISIANYTEKFLYWLRSHQRFYHCNLLLWSSELFLSDLAGSNGFTSFCPKGLCADILADHIMHLVKPDPENDENLVNLSFNRLEAKINAIRGKLKFSPLSEYEQGEIRNLMVQPTNKTQGAECLLKILEMIHNF